MTTKFGNFVHSSDKDHKLPERVVALRPKGVQWQWGEVSPLTRIMIAASAYLVSPNNESPNAMSPEYFTQSYSEAFTGAVTVKAQELARAGAHVALQEHVVLSAAYLVPTSSTLDSVDAIADIVRNPILTDEPLADFKAAFVGIHTSHTESERVASTLEPLRTLSLYASRGLIG